jgi:hypothetical protein
MALHLMNHQWFVRFQVLMVVTMKMTVFWDIAPCNMVEVYRCSDDGGSKHLWNGKLLQDYMVQHHRRQSFSPMVWFLPLQSASFQPPSSIIHFLSSVLNILNILNQCTDHNLITTDLQLIFSPSSIKTFLCTIFSHKFLEHFQWHATVKQIMSHTPHKAGSHRT